MGDAKNQVSGSWGPKQLEDYLAECDRSYPDQGPWRGILVQGVPEMAPSGYDRLRGSKDRERITVVAVTRSKRLRRLKTDVLFPEVDASTR